MADRLPDPAPAPPGPATAGHGLDRLTDREPEVPTKAAGGLSNTEIADELTLSEATVKTHVGRTLTKLELRDRVQTVVLAYTVGLVRPG